MVSRCAWFLVLLLTALPAVSRADDLVAQSAGYWRSEGYGLVFAVEGRRVSAFEVTAVSCLPAWSAVRVETRTPAVGEIAFQGGFESGEEDFVFRRGPDPETLLLDRQATIGGTLRLRRLAALPELCGQPAPSDALSTYRVLWTTFAEHYPSFARRGIDWQARDAEVRPKVSTDLTPTELFGLFVDLLSPLEDLHVLVQAFPPDTKLEKAWLKRATMSFQGERRDRRPISDEDLSAGRRVIERRYVIGAVRKFCEDRLRWGRLGTGIAYLEIVSFHGYAADDNLPRGLLCMENALDAVFGESQEPPRGLVLDLRGNSGGDDPLGFALASRLTGARYQAWSKTARLEPADSRSFSAPQPAFVEPSPRPGFHGPVVLLTSRRTASAAEVFAMALIGRSPRVTRIGESTQGAFSDVLDRRLPNGWRLVLPNEILRDAAGETYDVTGLPPDIETQVFPAADLRRQRDRALDKALEVLHATRSGVRRETRPGAAGLSARR